MELLEKRRKPTIFGCKSSTLKTPSFPEAKATCHRWILRCEEASHARLPGEISESSGLVEMRRGGLGKKMASNF